MTDDFPEFEKMVDETFDQLRSDAAAGDEFAALVLERHKLAEAAIMCDELEAGRIMSEKYAKRIEELGRSKTP